MTYRMGALADAEDAEEFEEDGAWALYLIFLCCTLALSVVVLNALIAVISETFDRLQEHSEALWVKGQAQLTYEVELAFGRQRQAPYLGFTHLPRA